MRSLGANGIDSLGVGVYHIIQPHGAVKKRAPAETRSVKALHDLAIESFLIR